MRLTVREAMEKRGLTPETLAEQANVHRATIYRLLAGEISDPSNSLAARLEVALRVKPRTLVFGEAMEQAS